MSWYGRQIINPFVKYRTKELIKDVCSLFSEINVRVPSYMIQPGVLCFFVHVFTNDQNRFGLVFNEALRSLTYEK